MKINLSLFHNLRYNMANKYYFSQTYRLHSVHQAVHRGDYI